MKKYARLDANHNQITTELRGMGYSVRSTAALGQGFADICVGADGRTYLFEIKDPAKPPSARRLTPDEEAFRDSWLGQYDVIETVEQAAAVIEGRLQ